MTFCVSNVVWDIQASAVSSDRNRINEDKIINGDSCLAQFLGEFESANSATAITVDIDFLARIVGKGFPDCFQSPLLIPLMPSKLLSIRVHVANSIYKISI